MHGKSDNSYVSQAKHLVSQQHSAGRNHAQNARFHVRFVAASQSELCERPDDTPRSAHRCHLDRASRTLAFFDLSNRRGKMMRVGTTVRRARPRKLTLLMLGRAPWALQVTQAGRAANPHASYSYSQLYSPQSARVYQSKLRLLLSTMRPQRLNKPRTLMPESARRRRLEQICSHDIALRATDRQEGAPATSPHWPKGQRRAHRTAQFSGSLLRAIQTTECRHGRV